MWELHQFILTTSIIVSRRENHINSYIFASGTYKVAHIHSHKLQWIEQPASLKIRNFSYVMSLPFAWVAYTFEFKYDISAKMQVICFWNWFVSIFRVHSFVVAVFGIVTMAIVFVWAAKHWRWLCVFVLFWCESIQHHRFPSFQNSIHVVYDVWSAISRVCRNVKRVVTISSIDKPWYIRTWLCRWFFFSCLYRKLLVYITNCNLFNTIWLFAGYYKQYNIAKYTHIHS